MGRWKERDEDIQPEDLRDVRDIYTELELGHPPTILQLFLVAYCSAKVTALLLPTLSAARASDKVSYSGAGWLVWLLDYDHGFGLAPIQHARDPTRDQGYSDAGWRLASPV